MVLARPSEYFEDPGEENWSKTAEFSQNYAKMQKCKNANTQKSPKQKEKTGQELLLHGEHAVNRSLPHLSICAGHENECEGFIDRCEECYGNEWRLSL